MVPNEQRVVGKIMAERIGVWTRQLGTPEYIVIVFYNEARAVRALSFGLLHWLPGQRLNY